MSVGSEVPTAPAAWRMRGRTAVIGLVALVALRAAAYLALGVDFVVDDRGFVARGVLFGVRSIGSDFRVVRPGAGLVYDVVYGLAGEHPVVLFTLVSLLNAAVVVALFVALSRFVSNTPAFLVAASWVLMANHTSLTVWGATAPTLVGLLLVLVGVIAATDRRWLWAAALLGGAITCYELFAPVALAVLGCAALRDRHDRAALRLLPVTVLAVALATAWSISHPIYGVDWRVPNPLLIWLGHFGTALLGGPSPPAVVEGAPALVVTLGALGAAVAWGRGERGRDDGPSLVLAGAAVMALGLLVSLTIPTTAFGTSDRLYAVSSIGGAMVVAGTVVWAARHWQVGTRIAVGGFLAACLVGQFVALRAWSSAGADGAAIIEGLGRRSAHPEDVDWVLGPSLLQRNAVIVMQTWDADYALRLAYGSGSGSVRVAAHPDEFRPRSPDERLVTWDELLGGEGG